MRRTFLLVSLAVLALLVSNPPAYPQNTSVRQQGNTTNSPPITGNGNTVTINIAPRKPAVSISDLLTNADELATRGMYDDAIAECNSVVMANLNTKDAYLAQQMIEQINDRKDIDPGGMIASHIWLGKYYLSKAEFDCEQLMGKGLVCEGDYDEAKTEACFEDLHSAYDESSKAIDLDEKALQLKPENLNLLGMGYAAKEVHDNAQTSLNDTNVDNRYNQDTEREFLRAIR